MRASERILDRLMGEHVVGRDAGLTGVVELSPDDAPGGDVEIGVLVDDARALAAELERDRRQVLGGGLHDDAADRAVARVEDVVEPLGQQRGRLWHAPFDDSDTLVIDIIAAAGWRCSSLVAGASSLGFTIAQLPAAIAPTSGTSTSWSG